ncbi:MAG: hypothetical protein JWM68_1558 [Verrucomicrobiales bacterium]|nr:hypothetical protein [Verrucomicrobiales bacterium]
MKETMNPTLIPRVPFIIGIHEEGDTAILTIEFHSEDLAEIRNTLPRNLPGKVRVKRLNGWCSRLTLVAKGHDAGRLGSIEDQFMSSVNKTNLHPKFD